MEMIGDYEIPDSWEAKGMNWNTPDPTNVDYVMAIRQALLERCAVGHKAGTRGIFEISPWKTVSREVVEDLVWTIGDVAGSFVNLGWEKYEDDLSDFPRMWTYGDLVQEQGCRLYEFPKYGSLVENGGEWLKQARNAIDRLTVVRAEQMFGRSLSRSGTRHDPPFGEAIGDAMDQAFDKLVDMPFNGYFPEEVYSWSGNTHWKCPRPDDDSEDNKDGYCGYAQCQAYRFTAARSWLLGAEFDLFAAISVTEPTGPVPYSVQLDTSILDCGGAPYRKGLNWTKSVHVKDPYDLEFVIGDTETIPRNEVVPESEFDSEGYAVRRHSAKRGWVGRCWGFLDYGVEGGFKFQPKEK